MGDNGGVKETIIVDNLMKKLNPYMSQLEQDIYVDNYIYSNNI